MNTFSPDRFFIPLAMPVLAALTLATSCLQAGTWSHSKWTDDADLPKAAPDSTTHAVVFGIETEPAPPPPFEITKKISGENWSVWTYPDHTATVEVSRRPENILDGIRKKEGSAVLIRGRILPKGKEGLTLELTGLDPGCKYHLVLFGPVVFNDSAPRGGIIIRATASDASDKPEDVKIAPGDSKYYTYEYTAPSDGRLTVDLENGSSDGLPAMIRLCSFLNYLVP